MPDPDARFKHTVRGHEEAGATHGLIDDSSSEIVPHDVLPVPLRFKLIDVDVSQFIDWHV